MKRKATGKRIFSPNTPADGAWIQAGIKADPDARELAAEESAHMRPLCELMAERRHPRPTRRKIPVVVRLEPHIVKFFRSGDADWQILMNAALAEYVRRHRPRR